MTFIRKTRVLSLIMSLAFSPVFMFTANAADDTQFSQDITGVLDVAIVDAGGSTVASPSVAFPSTAFSGTFQTSVATLGVSAERMRVTNPTGTDTWTLAIAATSGATASWSSGSDNYDFNDSTASAGDGADTDLYGGELTVDPSAGTIAGVSGTATTNVSLGASDAFDEGTTDSIDLMSASAGADAPGVWDLTGVGLSQTIPAMQATGSYTINMTVTAT